MKTRVLEHRGIPRIKVGFDETEYFINREKKTVTCKLHSYLVYPDGSPLYYVVDSVISSSKRLYALYINLHLTVATVRCNEGDEWDEVYGKRLAESKAKHKLYKAVTKFFSEVNYEMEKMRAHIFNLQDDMDDLSNHEEVHINRLLGEDE